MYMTHKDNLAVLFNPPFYDAVEKLENLMTQSNRTFLIGAGCSRCAGLPLMEELTRKTLASPELDQQSKDILEGMKTLFSGATDVNIEDYLSELIDRLSIVERRAERGAINSQIEINSKMYSPEQLRSSIEKIKFIIATTINTNVDISFHRNFTKAVHRPIRDGRVEIGQTVDYIILNYDTLIEDALALEKIAYSDGLEGGATAWWSPIQFQRKDISARVLKLHGSINWCEFPGDPLPRRIGNSVKLQAADDRQILIWPASTKYRETQLDPYAQLSDLVRKILRPDVGSQRVLVICGYRFGDSHINIEINRSLKESEGRLTIVAFTSDEQPKGQLKLWHDDQNVNEQILIFANRGFFHGKDVVLSDVDLPWWKFENVIRILGGER